MDESLYQELYQLALSDDPSDRDLATKAAAKLNDAERHAYFQFQQQQTAGRGERTRIDADPLSMAAGAGAVMAPAALSALRPAMGRLASKGMDVLASPVTGALAGGVEGYRHGGLIGAMSGAATGALGGGMLKGLRGLQTARKATKAANTGSRMVLTPAEVAQQTQLMKAAKPGAQLRGMLSAAEVPQPIKRDIIMDLLSR